MEGEHYLAGSNKFMAMHGLTYWAASDEPVEEVMQLVGLDEQLIHRHLARGRVRVPGHERHRPVSLGVRRALLSPVEASDVTGVTVPGGRVHLLVEQPATARGAALPAVHPLLEAVVEVRGEGADERGEVPGVGAGPVAEVGHVEHPRPAPRGVEHLLLERRVPVGEEAVHDDEGLERDRPAPGPAEAARQRGHAGADVNPGEAGERDDLPDVALVGGERLAVPGCLDDGHVEVRLQGAAAADLGEPDARLVLHRAQRLAQLARRHGTFPLPSPWPIARSLVTDSRAWSGWSCRLDGQNGRAAAMEMRARRKRVAGECPTKQGGLGRRRDALTFGTIQRICS